MHVWINAVWWYAEGLYFPLSISQFPWCFLLTCKVSSRTRGPASGPSAAGHPRNRKRAGHRRPSRQPAGAPTPPRPQTPPASGRTRRTLCRAPRDLWRRGRWAGDRPTADYSKWKCSGKAAPEQNLIPPSTPHPPIVLSLDCLISICPFSYFFPNSCGKKHS